MLYFSRGQLESLVGFEPEVDAAAAFSNGNARSEPITIAMKNEEVLGKRIEESISDHPNVPLKQPAIGL